MLPLLKSEKFSEPLNIFATPNFQKKLSPKNAQKSQNTNTFLNLFAFADSISHFSDCDFSGFKYAFGSNLNLPKGIENKKDII